MIKAIIYLAFYSFSVWMTAPVWSIAYCARFGWFCDWAWH